MCMFDLQPLGWILVWKSPHLSSTGPSLILKVQIHYGQLQDTVQSDLTSPLVSADATVHLHTQHIAIIIALKPNVQIPIRPLPVLPPTGRGREDDGISSPYCPLLEYPGSDCISADTT